MGIPDASYKTGSVPNVVFELCTEILALEGAVITRGTRPAVPAPIFTTADGLLCVKVMGFAVGKEPTVKDKKAVLLPPLDDVTVNTPVCVPTASPVRGRT